MPRDVPWSVRSVIGLAALIFAVDLLMLIGIVVAGSRPGLAELLAVTVVGSLLMLAGVWWLARGGESGWRQNLGFYLPRWWVALMLVGAQFFIYFLLWAYAVVAAGLGVKSPDERQVFAVFGGGAKGFIIAFVLVSLLAPLTEELFFRGLLFQALRRRMNLSGAAIVSGSIFAFFHLVPALFIPYLIIGVALALVYETSDSIISAMALHSLNNTVALVVYFLSR